MFGVLFEIFGVNENIVQVDKNKMIDEVFQDVISKCLEESRSICKPKRHYQVFKIAEWCS